ncbi:MAG: FHA domain-containing protein [Actinomycetota bacterium]
MPEIVLELLKYFFLLLIFLFLARAVKAMYLEILGPRAGRTRQPAPRPQSRPRAKPPERLAVITDESSKPRVYDIADDLIIGRDSKCHVVITDTYSSQVHARVFRKDDSLFIEDMGSTNGTYLNRRKVTAPTLVNRGDKARIGKTELEFRR